MFYDNSIYLGLSDSGRVTLDLSMCCRHGVITGASGTGKTVTMKVMAESFSDAGVPVFLCDIKGDVSGLAVPGAQSESMEKRIDKFGIRDSFTYKSYPCCLWDVYQENGYPVRVRVSDMGPDILSSLLSLTPAQEGVLNIIFKIADDHGLMLIDLKDLRALLNYVNEHRAEYTQTYGAIAPQSIGGILRALLPLESQGGDLFFGEPALDIRDWIRLAPDGRGMINILDCVKLSRNPKLYACFMLWMMSELFEQMPEVGDLPKPKIVFFFDEAHMLFTGAPKVLIEKIEQMVKLIRSKGVGIYFVTQNPADIPDSVLAQLSNRIQHALRAYTPAEQKAIRAAAQSMRSNPAFKTEEVIMQLGVGEALISVLDKDGIPGIVERTAVICPQSLMAAADSATLASCRNSGGMEKYNNYVDNESAYELLEERKAEEEEKAKLRAEREQLEKERAEFEAQKKKEELEAQKKKEKEEAALQKKLEKQLEKEEAARQRASERRKSAIERQLISTGGQILKRGLMNTLFKK